MQQVSGNCWGNPFVAAISSDDWECYYRNGFLKLLVILGCAVKPFADLGEGLASQQVVHESRAGDEHELRVCSLNPVGIHQVVANATLITSPCIEL